MNTNTEFNKCPQCDTLNKSRYVDIVIKGYRVYDIPVQFARFDCTNCENIWAVIEQREENQSAFTKASSLARSKY